MGIFISHAAAASPVYGGEWLEYQAYYSFIHAGTVTMGVDQQLHALNGYPCYKIQAQAISNSGLELLGLKVANTWVSYLELDLLRPHKFLVHIQENNYVREEQVDFDYQSNQAKVEIAESTNNMEHEVTYYPILGKNKIQDIISAYYSLRSIDTKKLKIGDKFTLSVFHDKQIYEDVGVIFLGKKTITTKLGKIVTMVFAPMFPVEGSVFSGERPVEIFISDDINKIPIKLKVNLVLGAMEMELTNYKGLKEAITFQKP